MAKIAKNTLGYLGVDFQYKLISAFMENRGFFRDMYPIIDQNMFTETYLKTIVGVMKEYFSKHDGIPSYSMLSMKLNEKAISEEDQQYYEEAIDRLKRETSEGIEEIEDMAERFFKQQNLVKIANEIKQIAGDGDMDKYYECRKMLEDFMSIERRKEDCGTPFENIEGDLSDDDVTPIPTNIPQLDEALNGGLHKGKLGLIVGSSGFGKTSLTTCFAHEAARTRCEKNNYEGYKVLQIVFEDTLRDIRRKYIAKETQIETCDLSKNVDEVLKRLETDADKDMIKQNVRILRLPTGEKTALDIKNEILKKINEGFKPDLVVIDYFECLKMEPVPNNSNAYKAEDKTMRKFEVMAPELDVAFWLTSQGNRDSVSAELVTNDKIGGSYGKIQIVQAVLTITRSFNDQQNNKATFSLTKNRGGKVITVEGLTLNNGTCTVSEDAVEFDSPLAYNEFATQKEEEVRKKMIREALKLHNESNI